jgi:hypothetical protein
MTTFGPSPSLAPRDDPCYLADRALADQTAFWRSKARGCSREENGLD